MKIFVRFFSIFLILSILSIFFYREIITKIALEYTLSNIIEKKTVIEKIDIDFKKTTLKLYNLKIQNKESFYYKNLLDCEVIFLDFNIKNLFSEIIIINLLSIKKPNFYFEINDNNEDKKDENKSVIKDNLSIIEKSEPEYKAKVYPPKKKDKNFIISNIELLKPKANIKFLDIYEYSDFKLSEMFFSNVGNSENESQHYKEVFKIFLLDMYLRIPDFEIRKKLKEIYKL